MSTKTKSLIEQVVRVEFVVHIEADEADLTMPLDELQERIVEHVKKERLGSVLMQSVADVDAGRGPGGYRYFPAEAVAEGFKWTKPDARAERPVTLTLTDLGYKEGK